MAPEGPDETEIIETPVDRPDETESSAITPHTADVLTADGEDLMPRDLLGDMLVSRPFEGRSARIEPDGVNDSQAI